MSSKLIEEKYLGYIMSMFMFLWCFWFFQENYSYVVKVNNFGSYSYFGPGSGQFHMFLIYVIKVDKREEVRLNFEHIYVLLLFLFFQESNYQLCKFHCSGV